MNRMLIVCALLSVPIAVKQMDAQCPGRPASQAGCGAVSTDVAAPVKQFIDDFNRGDSKAAFALYTTGNVSIIDEFAPNIWQGPKALQMWAADYDKRAAATGVTEGKVTYSAPTRIENDGSSAYVVMPAVYLYKEHGKPLREEAQIAAVLHKEGGAWKIVSWTWTGVKPHAGK